MSNDFETMSIEELEAAISQLTLRQRELKVEKLALQAVLNRKQNEAAAARKASAMSPSEKVALLQVLEADAIATSEEFGEI